MGESMNIDVSHYTNQIAKLEAQLIALHTTANRVAELYSAQYLRPHADAGRVAHAMGKLNLALSEASAYVHAPK